MKDLEDRRWFTELRAVLVLLHLVAIFCMGAPAPVGGLAPSTKEAPGVRQIFTDVSASTGIPAQDLEAFTWTTLKVWLEARDWVIKPFRPYYNRLGTRQSWRMMAVVNRKPARVRIELDGELAYRTGDPDARWMAELLEAARVRGVMFEWSWKSNRKQYTKMMEWLSERAKEERGPNTTFRSCMERVKPGLPGEETAILGCKWVIKR